MSARALVLALVLLGGCGRAVAHQWPPIEVPPPPPITPSPRPEVIPAPRYVGKPLDDPTRVTVSNCSQRATMRVRVDAGPEFVLPPFYSSRPENIPPLDLGDHEIRVVADVPTQIGIRSIPLPVVRVAIWANGRPQHFCFHE